MPPRGSACLCRNTRASARNPASSGVSLKSMRSLLRGARLEARDEEILPAARAPEREPEELGAAVVEVAVEFPGEAHATVGLDVLLGGEPVGLAGGDARGGGGDAELRRVLGERPRAVVRVRARQLRRH